MSLPVRFRLSSFGLCLPFLGLYTVLLLRYWLPRAKLCCFSAKSDRCDSTTRCSDGLRRCNRGGMQFNTFAEVHFSPFAEIVSRCGEIQPDRLPRAKLCCFSAKSDRCDSRTRRSDGFRRYNLASMKFGTLRERVFLRLPR